MDNDIKRIAVLTSGGDAPGMNAAIRAVTKAAISKGFEVLGIIDGYRGLVEDRMIELTVSEVDGISQCGGTMLGSARFKQFTRPDVRDKAIDVLKKRNIVGVVVIGGDGTFAGAQKLSHQCRERGYNCNVVGLPGTIDNDIACTDYTIGFDTCQNTIVEAIDKIRDTMTSHSRCCVVEVMGHHCCDLALLAALDTGAEQVIVEQKMDEYDIDKISMDIENGKKAGKKCHIVVVSELIKGLNVAEIAKEIEAKTKQMEIAEKEAELAKREEALNIRKEELSKKSEQNEDEAKLIAEEEKNIETERADIEFIEGVVTRATVLGHIQRGGSPSAFDRLLASRMSVRAVELLEEGKNNQVVSIRGNKIVNDDIDDALAMPRVFDEELYQIVKTLSV